MWNGGIQSRQTPGRPGAPLWSRSMRLSSLLPRNHIVVALESRNIEEAVRELLHGISAGESAWGGDGDSALGADWRDIADAIMTRESQSSTALEKGVAIPHARVPGMQEFLVALGIPYEPLTDCCADGSTVRLVFLIAGGEHKNALMLQTMAAVSDFASDDQRLEALCAAGAPRTAWEIIDKSGIRVKEELRARNLMRPAVTQVTTETLLSELLDEFFTHEVRVIPVCRNDGEIIGSVTSAEILQAGFPEYMSYLDHISFLSELESFDRFFSRENQVRVGEFMNEHPLVFDVDTPLIQVVFRMNRERIPYAFVVDNGRLTGFIDRHDIIIRVLRL